MKMSRTKQLCIAAVLTAIGVVAAPHHDAPAQQATPPTAALRTAAVWFGPLPTPSLFSPTVRERIEQLAVDDHWPMPDELKPWPLDEHQKPIVDTRQLDELWFTIPDGHKTTARRIRTMFRGRTSRYHALNPHLDLNELEPGDRVLTWQRNTDRVSQSIGSANRGRLVNGEPMPPGDNYVIKYPHRSFGTYYAISEIVRAMDAYKVRFPDGAPLIIGDLSFRTGRRIRPHKSHQSGRDVDISYPMTKFPSKFDRFPRANGRTLDVDRTLWLLKTFIDGGQVEYIFVDRYFQRLLVKEAKRQGAPREWIQKVFQYPNYSGTHAIIRHARGHRDHFHLRFKCQETDRYCR
jgi:murein endopeptidase